MGLWRQGLIWLGAAWLLQGLLPSSGGPLGPGEAEAKRKQLRGVMLTPNWGAPAEYGVTPADQAREVQAACALGSTLVRLVVNWPALEPAKGRTNQVYASRVHQALTGARRCGAKVVLTLLWTPCWASSHRASSNWHACGSAPPRKAALYGRAAKRILRRWGNRILAFEVWNEPNQSHFWRGSVRKYVKLVKAARRANSRLGKRAKILAGALAGADTGYLRKMYRKGLRRYDGISMHPYNMKTSGPGTGFADPTLAGAAAGAGSKAFRLGVRAVRRVMRKRGHRRKRIWLTEFGFAACPATPICVSEATQADWIAKSFRLAARWRYVRGLTLFSLRDVGPTARWEHRFGLLRRDFSARPSYLAVAATLATLPR